MTALTWARATATILAVFLFTASVALADIRVVVVSGDAAPDGNGVFVGANNSAFGTPALNASGHAAFTALLVGTTSPSSDSGIFVGDGFFLSQIAREGGPAPGGTFGLLATGLGNPFLFSPGINGAGQVVFEANVLSGGVAHQGIFRSSGPPETLVEIARAGAPAPDGDGTFFILGIPALNDAGQVAFTSTMSATAGFGIFRGDGSTITQIGRSGQAAPEGAGTFTTFSGPNAPGINGHGAVAFGDFLGQGTGVGPGGAILLSDGAVRLITRDGRPAPGAPGNFNLNGPLLGPVMVNEAGQVAFTFKGAGVSGNFTGVYLTQGTTLTEVARTGTTAPGSTQLFGSMFGVGLNDAGQVAFVGQLVPTTRGIFRTNAPAAGTRPIAFQFQATPDGRGTFGFLGGTPEGYAVALNNAGQVAFFSPVSGSTSSAGIFFHDDDRGLQQVARLGDPLLGSTITDLRFRGAQLGDTSQALIGREYTGLNDAGQVAFWFALADGRRGIAIWTPPAVVADPLADFVAGFYESLLGRTPPAGEVAPWVAFLRANCSPDGIRLFAGGFLHSDEYVARPTTVAARVTVLYDLFLGRVPDAPGQAGWTSAFAEAFNSLLPGFVGSAEFQFLLTTTAPEALVVRLYQQVLGRQPSAAEVQAWADFLRVTGDYSAFARGFLDSQEYLARPLSLAQHVTILYATFLGRAPDVPGRDGWVDFLDAQFQPIYNGFIDSAEFQGRLSLCR